MKEVLTVRKCCIDSTNMQKVLTLHTCKRYWQYRQAGSIDSTNCRKYW